MKAPLFIYPKTGSDAPGASCSLPMSILLAASLIPEAVLVDQRRVSDEYIHKLIGSRDWAYVGISAMTCPQIRYGLELSDVAHRHGHRTVWGGIHPTLIPEQTLEDPRVDCVVAGDGEYGAVTALTQETGIVRSPRPNLLQLPGLSEILGRWLQPEETEPYFYNKTAMVQRATTYLATRGCPFRCTYCSEPVLSGRKVQQPEAQFVVDDLLRLKRKFDLQGVHFLDEEFLANKTGYSILKGLNGGLKVSFQVRMDILNRFNLNELRNLGLEFVAPGLETGSSRLLKEVLKKDETIECFIEVNRKLYKAGIGAVYNFMVGLPYETRDDRLMSVELALRMIDDNPNCQFNTFYTFVPYPGTALWQTSLDLGFTQPSSLEEWSDLNRHHKKTPWTLPCRQELVNLEWSSKFVGRRIPYIFPEDEEIQTLHEAYETLWRKFDITDPMYEDLNQRAESRIKYLFELNEVRELKGL